MISSPTRKPFKLSQAIDNSPLKFTLLTTLPLAEKIKTLANINPLLAKEIQAGIKRIYSPVVERIPDEDKEHFFHHGAATTLYEEFLQVRIKDKNHSIKAGTTFNQIKKILDKINAALEENAQCEILKDFNAEFTAQYNIYVIALKKCAPEIKKHLQAHCSIDIDALAVTPITPRKKTRVQNMHPASPQVSTPKRLTVHDLKARRCLLTGTDASPVKKPLAAAALTQTTNWTPSFVPRTVKPKPVVASSVSKPKSTP